MAHLEHFQYAVKLLKEARVQKTVSLSLRRHDLICVLKNDVIVVSVVLESA